MFVRDISKSMCVETMRKVAITHTFTCFLETFIYLSLPSRCLHGLEEDERLHITNIFTWVLSAMSLLPRT